MPDLHSFTMISRPINHLCYLTAALLCLVTAFAPAAVPAQTMQFVVGGNGKLVISEDQKLIFAADQKAMQKDYQGAEAIYTRVLAMNGANIGALLQRGVVRREMHNDAGAVADGRAAATLANNALQANPRDPNLYYQRGLGFRLMKNYDQAEKDIGDAIRLGGQPGWQTDIQAIRLEKKLGR